MTWKKICDIEDVEANSVKLFDVDGIRILVVNYGAGFRVLPPVCPHMEEPLEVSAIVTNCVLTCSKHLWSWDLSTLQMLGETEKPLKQYDVKEVDGALFAHVTEELLYDFENEDELDDDFIFGQT